MQYQDVVAPQSQCSIAITMTLKNGVKQDKLTADIEDFCDRIPALVNSLRLQYPDGVFRFVFGIGARAWKRLFPNTTPPKELDVFPEIKGPKLTAVSTPGDLFFHIRAAQMTICHEMATHVHHFLGGIADPVDETHGFRYREGRAIIGFVDGTENPHDEEAFAAAFIGGEDPDYAGGSYAFTQKYTHQMDDWNALPVEEQEKAIGRKKWDDVELGDDVKPENAHNEVSKALDDDGEEMKIVRVNIPYAEPSKNIFGTYFIGYSKNFSISRKMLEHMFLGNPAGTTDRLLDFSTPTTGNLFFVPSYDLLDKIGSGELS